MTEWFVDYSQNRKIRELQDGLSSAHHQMANERNRMRSELSRVRGTLEQRLDRVSASLDAFIELSDIRATLAMFDEAAIARHRTLQMLDGVPLPRLDLKDTLGYWLVPAAHGLHALLSDDPDTARARFAEAARRDASRARHFAALATALTRAEHARAMDEYVGADLLPHLPDPDHEVTRGQRALWLLTADGAFGAHAREHLLLSTLRSWSERQVRPRALASPSLSPVTAKPSTRTSPRRTTRARKPHGITQRAEAAQRITALRENVARITTLDGGEASPEESAPDEVSAAFLDDTLRLLVAEGSPEEAPLLLRAGELRAVIEGDGKAAAQPPQRWTDPVGTVGSLLGDDLVRQDPSPHRRTFALALQRTTVMESAEKLVHEAAAPVRDTTVLNAQGVRMEITSNGAANQGELERARTQLRARFSYEGNARVSMWGLLTITGLLAVLGLVSGSGLAWFLCVATAVGAAFAAMTLLRGLDEARVSGEASVRRLDANIAEAAEKWRGQLLASEEHAVTARREAQEIDRLLNAPASRSWKERTRGDRKASPARPHQP
ncbi:hypothetical protein [Nocardiopsis halotolerans]|uniref:hypothetical protein n=1 Tax=Nocardiopsis halotolerans TaxID=124252 RepID=UPI0003461B94|nr:hypothetical protein [Nocardiopsis halotolerans]